MKNKKQIIRNIIIFILLIIVTFAVIFNNHNLKETIDTIKTVKLSYVLLGIFVMFLYFFFEGLNIRSILKSLGDRVTILNSIKYAMIGFFFSGITPAATGGQPLEIYYMSKEKIPATHSTLALLIQLCSFHIITIALGLAGAIVYHDLLSNGFVWIFIVGTTIKLFMLIAMFICLFSQTLSKKIVNFFLKILEKFKYKKIEKVRESTTKALEEYNRGSNFIRAHKNIFLRSILIVFIQIVIYYSVTYCVYRSFGLNSLNIVEINLIEALLFVSVSAIPLPGAIGVTESGFLRIYLTIFSNGELASAMLIHRGITFYLYIFITGIVSMFVVFKHKKSTN